MELMRELVNCSVVVDFATFMATCACLPSLTSVTNVQKRNVGPPWADRSNGAQHERHRHSPNGEYYDTGEQIVKAERLDLLVPTAERITEPHGAGR